jgi:hypothetical protein
MMRRIVTAVEVHPGKVGERGRDQVRGAWAEILNLGNWKPGEPLRNSRWRRTQPEYIARLVVQSSGMPKARLSPEAGPARVRLV